MEQRGPGTGWQLRYWSIFIGQSLSLIGSALTQFVLMWWITDTTGSVSALAMASIFALLPQAVLAPLGGTLADRYSRRLLMIGADAVSALCMAILIWLFLSHQIALWHVHAMLAVRGAMQAFQQPAATASTAMLVPHGFLPRAAGLNQTMAGIVAVAAAPLGALAISLMPIGWALSLDVLTAFLGIVPLCIFAIAQELPSRMRKASLWREFKDGVALVWQDRGLRTLFGLLTVTVLIVMPSYALVPLLVRNHFGGGASDVALLEGLAGFGMIAGGIFVAMLAPKRAMRWIIWGLAISCVLLGVLGLLPGTMFGTAIVIFVLSDISFVLGNVPLMARLQQIVPNHMQGRVLSIMNMLMGLAAPAGLALAMPIGDLVGVNWLFAAAGFLGAAITLLGLLSPALMRLDLR
ncbi:hypothetical protein TSO352_23005 [Azospirillum sp. TSO35-2]|nr:hypothetical protein TSO352_23005 [Azospirillum sp. TSO35-2]